MTALDEAAARLAPVLGERLVAPGDPGFADLARLMLADGRTPALIARPRDTAEVAEVVRTVAATGVPFAVRAGGHSYARHGVAAGGLTLDLRLLAAVRIDPAARAGHAGGGVTAGAYTAAAAEHGLATGFGDTPSVGVGGLALGGGIGYLSRRDGLTVDNVLAAEVVLADGGVVRASADEHPDLFWALRGGGGNFGVVTRWELRLTPAGPVTGGAIVFEPGAETVDRLLAAAREAPDELSLMVNVMKAPPAPFLPAERHGTPVVAALVCHAGRPEDADAALAPFRAAGPVVADVVRLQPYSAMFRPEDAGNHATLRTGFGDGPDAAAAIELVRDAPSAVAVVNLRPMGGAIARVAEDATAFAHRRHAVMQSVAAVDPPGAGGGRGSEWVAGAAAKLGVGEGPGYVNFVAGSGPGAVRAAYPEPVLRRLAEVKRAYDPRNLFRGNHNVLPGTPPRD